MFVFYQKHHEQFLLLQLWCPVNLQHFQTVAKYGIAEMKNAACISLHNFLFFLQQTSGFHLYNTFLFVSRPEVTTAMIWHSQSYTFPIYCEL